MLIRVIRIVRSMSGEQRDLARSCKSLVLISINNRPTDVVGPRVKRDQEVLDKGPKRIAIGIACVFSESSNNESLS